jgi:c(7)-type cytochrome triheme protein
MIYRLLIANNDPLMTVAARRKNSIKAALLLAALIVFAAACFKQAERSAVPVTSSETPDPVPVRASTKTFQDFSHKIPEHQQFACNTCHQREARASLSIDLAGHESCVGCHLNQFTTREDQVMCTICHTDTKSDDPPVKAFPAKFIEGFNMKFDHAAHERGEGRPAQGCSACHNSSGPGKTIPIGFQAHADCFGCHTAESKIGQCSVCHQLAPYARTTQSQYGFKAIFTHGQHSGMDCNECHHVSAGAPNSRQVSNIQILEHRTSGGNNCLQCHNGKRAFTGNNPYDVGSCTRCHKGAGFGQLPLGSAPPEEE